MKVCILKLNIIIGYCWTEWYAAGRQEAPGAESQRGIQERHSGECPGAGQMTAGWWEAGCSLRDSKVNEAKLLSGLSAGI